ncbi:hypothetical protein Tco_0524510 [Tanacetum coccineum]
MSPPLYPPSKSESSTGILLSESSAGHPRKRCRYPTATVTSSFHAMRGIVPSRADHSFYSQRFRESTVSTCRISIGMEVDVGVDVEDEVEDEVESYRLGIPLQRVEDIETGQRELEARSLIASGERACLLKQIRMFRYYDRMRFRRLETFATRHLEHDYHSFWYDPEAIEELINRRVEEALAAYEAIHAANVVDAESQSQNGSDGDNRNGGNRNGRDGNPNENDRGARPDA